MLLYNCESWLVTISMKTSSTRWFCLRLTTNSTFKHRHFNPVLYIGCSHSYEEIFTDLHIRYMALWDGTPIIGVLFPRNSRVRQNSESIIQICIFEDLLTVTELRVEYLTVRTTYWGREWNRVQSYGARGCEFIYLSPSEVVLWQWSVRAFCFFWTTHLGQSFHRQAYSRVEMLWFCLFCHEICSSDGNHEDERP